MSEMTQQPPTDGKQKKNKQGKSKKEPITPEMIEEKRKLREQKKLMRQELINQGLDPDNPNQKPKYIKRELIEIPHDGNSSGEQPSVSIKIMSYNLLAQALIRRTLFPENGDILKWSNRSKILIQEIKNYNCDILCLQEVDLIQHKSFWKPQLESVGFHTKFYRGIDKNHGISIFYKESMFKLVDTCLIDFDKEKSGDIKPRTVTKNAGLILGLALKSNPENVLIIGTAHLFWHPFGTYERTRQTYLILKKSMEFESRIKSLNPDVKKFWKFFGGDFNSQPFDAPYLSITAKPIKYDERCLRVISCSTSYTFSKLREGDTGDEEEGGNIEKYGENQPKDPVPESFEPTEEQIDLVDSIEKLHNDLPLRAISLYSVAYKLIDSNNSGIDNDRGEPFFSNWAHTWRGMLDYIFLIKSWDGTDASNVDELSDFESENDIVIEKLLKLPHPDEMDKGQPRTGEYPSDHLCIIAQIGLKL